MLTVGNGLPFGSEHFPKEVTKENIQGLIELAKKIDAKANQTSYGLLSIFLLTCSNCSVGHRLLILDKLDCSEVLEDFGIKVVTLPAGLDWKMLGDKTRFSVYIILYVVFRALTSLKLEILKLFASKSAK